MAQVDTSSSAPRRSTRARKPKRSLDLVSAAPPATRKKKQQQSHWTYATEMRPFEDARAFVRTLTLKTSGEYSRTRRAGQNIPSWPPTHYGSEWTNWADFLGPSYNASGARNRMKKKMRSYEAAKAFAHGLKLSNARAWRTWCGKGKRPADIPSNPHTTYGTRAGRSDWIGWEDFLGPSFVPTYGKRNPRHKCKKRGCSRFAGHGGQHSNGGFVDFDDDAVGEEYSYAMMSAVVAAAAGGGGEPRRRRGAASASSSNNNLQTSSPTLVAQLMELDAMREQGLLTQEEFDLAEEETTRQAAQQEAEF